MGRPTGVFRALRSLGVAFAVSFGAAGPAAARDVSDQMLLNAASDPANWIMAPRDYSSTRFSPLTQVNTATVKRLVPVWSFSFGVLDAQNTTPLVLDGVMYVTSSHGRIFAVDARTGTPIWSYSHPLPEGIGKMLCCDLGNRGAALYKDKVYYATPDAHVIALDRATGKVAWDVTVGDWTKAYTMTVAPLVVKGKVVVGMSGAEYPTRLYIEALDPDTGAQVWRRYTTRARANPGMTPGATPIRTSGNSAAARPGSPAPTTRLWTRCTGARATPTRTGTGSAAWATTCTPTPRSALNPDNGEIKYHYQYTPWDVWDFDGVNETILADLGDKRVWLHGDRNGLLYQVDRTNGKLVWGKEISKVNWMTGFTPEGRPIINQDKVPTYTKKAKDVCPASEGGKWWNPMAYHPELKMVFVPSREICVDILAGKSERVEGKYNLGIAEADWVKGYGQLVGFDAVTGEKVWTVKAASPFTSGVLTTAGGLVFAGTPEGEFSAYDAKSGKRLWSYQTGSGIVGSPMSFSIDGKQYIAVPSGWGGWTGWATWGGKGGAPHLKDNRKGGYVTVFALFTE